MTITNNSMVSYATQNYKEPVERLDNDCLERIFFHLQPTELGKIATVSKRWARLCNSEGLWYKICVRDIQNVKFTPGVTFKKIFKEQGVLWSYLNMDPQELEIKKRMPQSNEALVKIEGTTSLGKANFLKQNRLVSLPVNLTPRCLSLYASLAVEIFGDDITEEQAGKYITILRNATENFVKNNPKHFLSTTITESTIPLICRVIREALGLGFTAEQLKAISMIFATPIHFFSDIQNCECSIESEGIQAGVIQPNIIYGKNFMTTPIRIVYHAKLMIQPARLITKDE